MTLPIYPTAVCSPDTKFHARFQSPARRRHWLELFSESRRGSIGLRTPRCKPSPAECKTLLVGNAELLRKGRPPEGWGALMKVVRPLATPKLEER